MLFSQYLHLQTNRAGIFQPFIQFRRCLFENCSRKCVVEILITAARENIKIHDFQFIGLSQTAYFLHQRSLAPTTGEISTVFTPCWKFSNRRPVSFSRSVKLSPDVATPNIKGLFSIIFKCYLGAKMWNSMITNNVISNKVIIAAGFLYASSLLYSLLLPQRWKE